MKRALWHWIISAIALFLAALALNKGVHIKPLWNVLWLAPVLGVVNGLVGAVASFLSWLALPINVLFLGGLSFILSLLGNVLVIFYMGGNSGGHPRIQMFQVDGFWWAFALSIVLALFSTALNIILPGKDARRR